MAQTPKLIILIASSMISLTACGDPIGDKYVSFAKCLTQKNVTMYGAYWCPHCTEQKALFGPQGFKEVNYVECDQRGALANPELCAEKNVQRYPTWIFPDGSRAEGELTLMDLSAKTSCPLTPGALIPVGATTTAPDGSTTKSPTTLTITPL